MTVIAKLYVSQVVDFGTGTFAQLGCVCENDLMAAYATSEEDKLFSRYSPWGEMKLNQRAGWAVFHKPEDEHVSPQKQKTFYAVLVGVDEIGPSVFRGAAAFIKVDCYSKTKFAQDGSRVELREAYGWKPEEAPAYRPGRDAVIERLSWKMHVDNPPAEAGFVPGKSYWLAFFDADRFGMHEALARAMGHPDPEHAAE